MFIGIASFRVTILTHADHQSHASLLCGILFVWQFSITRQSLLLHSGVKVDLNMKLYFVLDLFVFSRVGEFGHDVRLVLIVHEAHDGGRVTSLCCTHDLENKLDALTHCILGNFHAFLSSADFFQNSLFKKLPSGIPSECT